jgi:hypothetical protein
MAQRLNPRSLVNVLRSIRESFSGTRTTLKQFAERFAEGDFEYGTRALSYQQLNSIENNRSHLAFWQIEMYAKYIGVPAAFILLLSRLSSEFKKIKREFPNGPQDRKQEMLSRLSDISKLMKQFRNVCDYVDGQMWEIYNRTLTDEEIAKSESAVKIRSGIHADILSELYQIFCEGRKLSPEEIHSLLPINASRKAPQPLIEESGVIRQFELFRIDEILSRKTP